MEAYHPLLYFMLTYATPIRPPCPHGAPQSPNDNENGMRDGRSAAPVFNMATRAPLSPARKAEAGVDEGPGLEIYQYASRSVIKMAARP